MQEKYDLFDDRQFFYHPSALRPDLGQIYSGGKIRGRDGYVRNARTLVVDRF
jgi:hypothetical protein